MNPSELRDLRLDLQPKHFQQIESCHFLEIQQHSKDHLMIDDLEKVWYQTKDHKT